MKLLELQPEVDPGTPPEPPEGAAGDQPEADPAARTCRNCGATMEPGQDWCLACGTAAGRLEEHPGRRPALAVLAITALLVAGAVASSYAALRNDPAAPPATSTAQVAQAPPATIAPPAATTAPPQTTPGTPTTPGSTSTHTLPKVDVPTNGSATPAPSPAKPSTSATPSPPSSTATPRASASPPVSTGSGRTGTGQTGSGTTNTATTPAPTTPKPTTPVAMDLPQSAASVYDPYRHAAATGVPGRAIDGD